MCKDIYYLRLQPLTFAQPETLTATSTATLTHLGPCVKHPRYTPLKDDVTWGPLPERQPPRHRRLDRLRLAFIHPPSLLHLRQLFPDPPFQVSELFPAGPGGCLGRHLFGSLSGALYGTPRL